MSAGKYNILKYYYKFLITITGSSRYLLFSSNAWNFYITKYRNTLHSHYSVVPGARFWTTGHFKVLSNCKCISHLAIILSSKQHTISKVKCNILVILILLFGLSFFLCWNFVTQYFINKFIDFTALHDALPIFGTSQLP